jgi:hypothetical protein
MFGLALLVGAAAGFYVPALSPFAVQRTLPPGAVTSQDPMQQLPRFEAGELFGRSAPMPPASRPEFFVVLATGIAFLVMILAKRSKMHKAEVASYVMTPAFSDVVTRTRAGGPPLMSDSWSADDDEELRREMDRSLGSQQLIRGPAEHVMRYRIMAYVLVFNRGTPNEGIYTLEGSAGGSRGQLLTFENTEDANRFASQLEGTDFTVVGNESRVSLEAQPLLWDSRRIAHFCQGGNFEVALVPSGGMITPPEKNMWDPERFGDGPSSSQERFQNRFSMQNRAAWDQRRRAHDILRNTNMTNGQKRGQEVWEEATRNAMGGSDRRQPLGEEMCGVEECGLDKYLGERDALERIYGSGPWGTEPYGPGGGPGPWGPGPEGPGPYGRGPYGPGRWGQRPSGPGPWMP